MRFAVIIHLREQHFEKFKEAMGVPGIEGALVRWLEQRLNAREMDEEYLVEKVGPVYQGVSL